MEDEHAQVRKHRREHRHKVRKRGTNKKAAKSAKHWIRKTERRERKRNKQRPADGGGCTVLYSAARPSPTSTYSRYMP